MELATLVAHRARVDGDLIRVDDFLNHRVEPGIMRTIGSALAERFRAEAPDLVLTAEASGIPPGMTCALELDIPLVYARKYLGPGPATRSGATWCLQRREWSTGSKWLDGCYRRG